MTINGQLEIDHRRGVIYFHVKYDDMVYTALRICRLPSPIPIPTAGECLDVIHMVGASWNEKNDI